MSLYSDFKKGKSTILNEFVLKRTNVKDTVTKEDGLEVYISQIKHSEGRIDFKVFSGYGRKDELRYAFYYYNKQDLLLFDNFSIFMKGKDTPLKEWLINTIAELKKRERKEYVNFMFGDRDFKVYGSPQLSIQSAHQFAIVLVGYAFQSPKEILVYRIKHFIHEGNYRIYTYAIFHSFIKFIYDYSYWSVFPAFCGPDSGTASIAQEYVETAIKEIQKKTKIRIVDFDCEYEEIKRKFLPEIRDNVKRFEEFDPNKEQINRLEKKIDRIDGTTQKILNEVERINKIIEENPNKITRAIENIIRNKNIPKEDKGKLKTILDAYNKLKKVSEQIEFWKNNIEKIKPYIPIILQLIGLAPS